MADDTNDAMEKMVACAWQPDGGTKVTFMVTRISERVDKRLVSRKRPYRRGSKQDCYARDHMIWELEGIFFNDPDEPNIDAKQYPDNVEAMCSSIDVDATGDLTLSTRGTVRAQFKGYVRTDDAGLRNAATMALVFWEDNEDEVTQQSFATPSARSVSRVLAGQINDDALNAGSVSDAVSSINSSAAQLENLANAPGEFVDDLDAQAKAVSNAVERVESTFMNAGNRAAQEFATLATRPEQSHLGRTLRRLSDVARRSTLQANGAVKIVTRRFPRQLSIFDIAGSLGQDPGRLLGINPGLENPFAIPPRTAVRVFESA